MQKVEDCLNGVGDRGLLRPLIPRHGCFKSLPHQIDLFQEDLLVLQLSLEDAEIIKTPLRISQFINL